MIESEKVPHILYGECYCENCERAFREWLKKRYGTLEELNRRWYTSFWGHTFYDWEEIVLPDTRSEHIDEKRTMCQGRFLRLPGAAGSGVEAASRVNQKGTWVFLLNHTEEPQEVRLPWKAADVLNGSAPAEDMITIPPKELRILKKIPDEKGEQK